MKRPYSTESLGRGLIHHELQGTIRSWSPPESNGRSTWLIREVDGTTYEFNTPQTYAFVVGLAAASRAQTLREAAATDV